MNKDKIKNLCNEMRVEFNKYNDNEDFLQDKDYYNLYNNFKKIFFNFFENDVVPEIKKLNRLGDSTYSFLFKYPSFEGKSAYLIIHFLLKIHEEFFKDTGISFQYTEINSDKSQSRIAFNWRV